MGTVNGGVQWGLNIPTFFASATVHGAVDNGQPTPATDMVKLSQNIFKTVSKQVSF